MKPPVDQQVLKRISRTGLWHLLLVQPDLSLAALAQESGSTKRAVSAPVGELFGDNWLAGWREAMDCQLLGLI